MKCWAILLVILPSLLVSACAAQTQYRRNRIRTVDIIHYAIQCVPDERNGSIQASVRVEFAPLRSLDTLELDAAGLNISDVRSLQGSALPYILNSKNETIRIALPHTMTSRETTSVTISYTAVPFKGMYFIRPDSTRTRRTWQVWTQGAMEDNHFWFPCYDRPDDKATHELTITVPDTQQVMSNGYLAGNTVDSLRHVRTFHWIQDTPVSSYLISFVAGEYAVYRDSLGTLPVDAFVAPARLVDAPRSFSGTPQMISWFAQWIGVPYPWKKYDQATVSDFMYGGMENVSATTLTDATLHSEREGIDEHSEPLVAHELSHQWFGDLVTCRDWAHTWLNEGFATYMEAMYEYWHDGLDAFQLKMDAIQNTARNGDQGTYRRPIVKTTYVDPEEMFDSHSYQKGASVLHMLRFVVGDDIFQRGVSEYVKKFSYQCADTKDFQRVMESVYGQSLDWFFQEWLYQAGYPEFEITKRWDPEKKSLIVTVRQIQLHLADTPVFTMPMDLEITTSAGSSVSRISISRAEETFQIPCAEPPLNVIVDKGGWILKTVRMEKSVDEWLMQCRSPRALDRRDALRHFGDEPVRTDPRVVTALMRAARLDSIENVAVTAIRSLELFSSIDSVSSFFLDAALGRGLTCTGSRCRIAAIQSLDHLGDERQARTILETVMANDSSFACVAQAMSTLAHRDSSRAYELFLSGLSPEAPSLIIRTEALRGISRLQNPDVDSILLGIASYDESSRMRSQAIRSFGYRHRNQGKGSAARLLNYLKDPAFGIRSSAIEAIRSTHDPDAVQPLTAYRDDEHDARLRKSAEEAIIVLQSVKRK